MGASLCCPLFDVFRMPLTLALVPRHRPLDFASRRVRVDPLGMAEADIANVVPCGTVRFRPV